MSLAIHRGFSIGSPVQGPRIKTGFAISFSLVGQFEPVAGHAEEEDPAVRVADVLGKFDAVGGIEAVASDSFASHRHSPECR